MQAEKKSLNLKPFDKLVRYEKKDSLLIDETKKSPNERKLMN